MHKLIFISNSNRLVFHRNFYVLFSYIYFQAVLPAPTIYNLITTTYLYSAMPRVQPLQVFFFLAFILSPHVVFYIARSIVSDYIAHSFLLFNTSPHFVVITVFPAEISISIQKTVNPNFLQLISAYNNFTRQKKTDLEQWLALIP